jgi:hypothetical protein
MMMMSAVPSQGFDFGLLQGGLDPLSALGTLPRNNFDTHTRRSARNDKNFTNC